MPTTLEATEYLQKNNVLFAPGKAANAGGVATSALEMSQNSERLSWTFEEVDAKLQNIMVNIFHNLDDAAKRYNMKGDSKESWRQSTLTFLMLLRDTMQQSADRQIMLQVQI